MTKDEALDLALEELENCADLLKVFEAPLDSCVGASMLQAEKAIAAIKQARALDKKAENARELGLDYEPVLKDNSNYRLDPPVAEPVVFYRCNGCGHAYEQVHPTSCDCMEAGGFDRVEYYTTPPKQPAPVQEPVALGKPTDEMVQAATDEYDEWAFDNKGTTECIRAMLVKALKVQPAAQPAPEQDEHQAFIDSLPTNGDDKMYMQIHHWARQSYKRHQSLVRGQMITAADASDTHIIWAALRWAKENASPAQPAPVQEPVAMTFDEAWASLSWQEWRTKSPKELFAELHRLTTPPAAQPAPSQYGSPELQEMILALAIEKNRAAQPAVPLTDGVTVPMAVLEAAEASLGSFCSDHGWSDKDMQNMDNLSAYIARHKAAHGITKGQP